MTPRTATGRKLVAIHGAAFLDDVLGIEAEAATPGDEGLRERIAPLFSVSGDEGFSEGVMRRCLICGRTSKIVLSPQEPTPITHEPECALADPEPPEPFVTEDWEGREVIVPDRLLSLPVAPAAASAAASAELADER